MAEGQPPAALPDTSDHSLITPIHGLPLATLIVSIIFPTVATISVVLRTYVVHIKGSYGYDDFVMIFGGIAYLCLAGLTVYASLVGVGYKEVDFVGHNWNALVQAPKLYIAWLMTYIAVLAIVKTSICITVYRLAVQRSHIIAVWTLLALNWISWLVLLIGIVTYCQPWDTLWRPELLLTGRGTCAPASQLVAIGQVATWTTVVGDFCLAAMPGLILWKTHMPRKTKIQLFGLLSFGSVACFFTVAREPFLRQWLSGDDLMYVGGFIAILGMMEIGVGITAASIPRFRAVFTVSFWRNGCDFMASGTGWSNGGNTPNGQHNSIVTFGQGSGRGNKAEGNLEGENYDITLAEVNAWPEKRRAGDNWKRLPDNASDKELLHREQPSPNQP